MGAAEASDKHVCVAAYRVFWPPCKGRSHLANGQRLLKALLKQAILHKKTWHKRAALDWLAELSSFAWQLGPFLQNSDLPTLVNPDGRTQLQPGAKKGDTRAGAAGRGHVCAPRCPFSKLPCRRCKCLSCGLCFPFVLNFVRPVQLKPCLKD